MFSNLMCQVLMSIMATPMVSPASAVPNPCPVGPQSCDTAATGTCKLTVVGKFETKYRRTFLRVLATGFGLFGSTRTCYQEFNGDYKYEYQGPPINVANHCPPPPTPSHGHEPSIRFKLRFLNGKSSCYGQPVIPDQEATMEALRYTSLDGRVLEIQFTPITGTLGHFLGQGFDPAPFDPAYIGYANWSGCEAFIPSTVLVVPTLTLQSGGDPQVPTQGMMNLQQPDQKVLWVDLGIEAANSALAVVVSNTAPGDGPLMNVDGVTVPIVQDGYTDWFEQAYPNTTAVADSQGRAIIVFPMLADPALEGVDLNVAVIARDATTNLAISSSTFTCIQLRDLGLCP